MKKQTELRLKHLITAGFAVCLLSILLIGPAAAAADISTRPLSDKVTYALTNSAYECTADTTIGGTAGSPITVNLIDKNYAGDYYGLFGDLTVAEGKTLTVQYVDFTIPGTGIITQTGHGLGLFAGYLTGSVIFDHCTVNGDTLTSNNNYIGSLVGYANDAHINALDCNVNVKAISTTGGSSLGGLVGYASSASTLNFENCTVGTQANPVAISASGYKVGGLLGCVDTGIATGSFHAAGCTVYADTISSTAGSDAGGLIGGAYSTGTFTMENCIVGSSANPVTITA
ncbi:MAG TPA: hypothetical protein O0X70_07910, partial [Methanocorpusculum sp.]|nr:hypothetical protein [Methanocorpusculum sp.]